MSKLIVIMGITGTQGSSVADVFLQEPGWKIRGTTRDLNRPSSKSWERQGIEMVKADVDDIESLTRAFRDAHADLSNPLMRELLGREPKTASQLIREFLEENPDYTWHQNYIDKAQYEATLPKRQ